MNVHTRQMSHRLGRGVSVPSALIAGVLFGLISVLLTLTWDVAHFPILVVATASATLGGTELLDAVCGRRSLLSPRALLSLLIVIGVYVAPIMHAHLGLYPLIPSSSSNFEIALSRWVWWQLAAMIVYRMVLVIADARPMNGSSRKRNWVGAQDDGDGEFIGRFSKACYFFGAMSLAVFMWTVVLAGGPASWLSQQTNFRNELNIPGWLLALGEAFPSLFFMGFFFATAAKGEHGRAFKVKSICALVLLVCLTFMTSGLRGSRANLIWALVPVLILLELTYFKLRSRWLVILAILAVSYSGAYDLYKKSGLDATSFLQSAGDSDGLVGYREYPPGLPSLILGDFSRTGVQAALFERYSQPGFELYWGRTYIGDALEFVPGFAGNVAFPSKRLASTVALHGEGFPASGRQLESRIFGLQGEGLLNFGPFGSALVFVVLSVTAWQLDEAFRIVSDKRSARQAVLVAFLTPGLLLLFVSDLDNVFYFLTSKALLPVLAVVFAGRAVLPPRRLSSSGRR